MGDRIEVTELCTGLIAEDGDDFIDLLDQARNNFAFYGQGLTGFLSGRFIIQLIPGAADRESFKVKERSDPADELNLMTLVIPPVATAFYRVELIKLLFPVSEYVRFDGTQIADFTDCEIPLTGNRRKSRVVALIKHVVLRWSG